MQSQHVKSWGIRALAVLVVAFCLCLSAQAGSAFAAVLDTTATQANLAGGGILADGAIYAQTMVGAKRRPVETIDINKSYARDASKYDVHSYRFKSKGDAYILKVNNKVKGSTATLDVSSGTLKGYLTTGVTIGKAQKSSDILLVGEWCPKGVSTFKLGTIKKGRIVNLSFYAYPRSSDSKFSFKVVVAPKVKLKKSNTTITVKDPTWTGKALKPAVSVKCEGKKLKKGTDYTVKYSNNKKIGTGKVVVKGKGKYTGKVSKSFTIKPKGYIYAAVYGGAKGESPSSTPQVKLMCRTFKKLKVPGYTVKEIMYTDQPSFTNENFEKLLHATTKDATKNDLVFVYINAHGKGIAKETTDFMGVTKTEFDYSPGIATSGEACTWKHLLDMIASSTKGKVFLATEVCYSGNLVKVVKNHSIKNRITIFTGASEDRSSCADNFTRRLAEGLITPYADINASLKVTAKEVDIYIKSYWLILAVWQQPKFYSCNKSFVLYG